MEGVSFGPLFLRWNGILLILGISLGALLAMRESKRYAYDSEIIYYLFLPLTVFATISARLWHILTPPLSSVELGLTTQYYLSHPVDMLALWVGGFGIPGALIGGLLALIFFAQRNQLSFWILADILAPGLAVAQAIGRFGNYFNQELYGLPTNLPWKIFIDVPYRLIGYETQEYYHPLFIYEVILNFANLIFLLWISRRFADKLKTGDIFLAYLGFYSVARFLLEFLRLDIALVSEININQVFFAITFLVAGIRFYLSHKPQPETVRSL